MRPGHGTHSARARAGFVRGRRLDGGRAPILKDGRCIHQRIRSLDRGDVSRLVELLETEGFSVWWDSRIDGGQRWDETIEHELDIAKCIIVVWNSEFVLSRWVRTRASAGLDRGILLPLTIKHTAQPLAFRLIVSITFRCGREPQAKRKRQIIRAVHRIVKHDNIGIQPNDIGNYRIDLTPTPSCRQKNDISTAGNIYVYISEDKIFSLSLRSKTINDERELPIFRKLSTACKLRAS